MTIACPGCLTQYDLAPTLAGRSFKCGTCGKAATVPNPADVFRPGPAADSDALASAVPCPGCSRSLRVPPDKSTGWLACPACSLTFKNGPRPTAPLPLPQEDSDIESTDPAYRIARLKHMRFVGVIAATGVAGWLLLSLLFGSPFSGRRDKGETARGFDGGTGVLPETRREPTVTHAGDRGPGLSPAGLGGTISSRRLDRGEDIVGLLKNRGIIALGAGNPTRDDGTGQCGEWLLTGKNGGGAFMYEFKREVEVGLFFQFMLSDWAGTKDEVGLERLQRDFERNESEFAYAYGRFLIVCRSPPLLMAIREALP